jgi:hypothetical protein
MTSNWVENESWKGNWKKVGWKCQGHITEIDETSDESDTLMRPKINMHEIYIEGQKNPAYHVNTRSIS